MRSDFLIIYVIAFVDKAYIKWPPYEFGGRLPDSPDTPEPRYSRFKSVSLLFFYKHFLLKKYPFSLFTIYGIITSVCVFIEFPVE